MHLLALLATTLDFLAQCAIVFHILNTYIYSILARHRAEHILILALNCLGSFTNNLIEVKNFAKGSKDH